MKLLATTVVVSLCGCSLGLQRLPAGYVAEQTPQCSSGKGAVRADTAVTVLAGLATLLLASGDSGDAAGGGALVTIGFGTAALVGSAAVDRCRAAQRDHEQYVAGLAAPSPDKDLHRRSKRRRPAPRLQVADAETGDNGQQAPGPQPANSQPGNSQPPAAPATAEEIPPGEPRPSQEPAIASPSDWSAFWVTRKPGRASGGEVLTGTVVLVEHHEIYFNLGSGQGLTSGSPVRLKRPLQLRHPITGAKVADWLPLGTSTVTVVGKQLSMAQVAPKLLAQVSVGDTVQVLLPAAPEPAPPTAPVKPDSPVVPNVELPQLDDETAAVIEVWNRTLGAPLEVRIAQWERYLHDRPAGPYTATVRHHLTVLATLRTSLTPPTTSAAGRSIEGLAHTRPTRAPAGAALGLVFVLTEPDQIAAGTILYRRTGDPHYQRALLERDGSSYFRVALPAEVVQAPGAEYFVELITSTGTTGFGAGSPDAPLTIPVADTTLGDVFERRANRSRVSLTTTFLDYATFDGRAGNRKDQVLWLETDFLYRLDSVLYGIRVGYGAMTGAGGIANDERATEPGYSPSEIGFNFGYAELEFRGPKNYSYAGRLVAGVGDDGFGLGVEARLRLGAEHGDHLSLGLSNIQQVGFLSEMRMQWNAFESFPLGFAVAVTDQPGNGDLGVRLTTDLGWRATSWAHPTLRISYQGRTVTHSGVGAGLGVVFDW